jgi:hypothetical protein
VPTDSSLYFSGAVCQPGDYQGKNNGTEALAYCSFTDGQTQVLESAAVATKVNATLAWTRSSWDVYGDRDMAWIMTVTHLICNT